MKLFTILIILFTLLCAPMLRADTIEQTIPELIKQTLPSAMVGVVVRDAKTGQLLYQTNGYQLFNPASNTKLFTTAASLFYLGPNYRYKTSISLNKKTVKARTLNGDLYIHFSGDPSLSVNDLQDLVKNIKRYGINTIKGNIVIDNTHFQKPDYPLGISYEDLNWYYAAPVDTVIVNENALALRLTPSKTLGKDASLSPGKFARGLLMQNSVETVTEYDANHTCSLNINVNQENRISMSGCWPINGYGSTLKIAIKNPVRFAKKIIATQLKKSGIALQGKIITGKQTKSSTSIAIHESKPLSALVIHTLKYSDNLYADAFTKTLGFKYFNKGTIQAGTNAIKAILSKKTDIDFSKMDLSDGSGSRFNMMSPQQITQLLYTIYHTKKMRTIFLSALPDSGRSGTLKNRMQAFDLQNTVHAKTGTMHDISALSGYITTLDKRELIFSILINNVIEGIAPAKHLENKICSILLRYPTKKA